MSFFKNLLSGKNVTKNLPNYAAAQDFYNETASLTKDLGLDVLDWSKEKWGSQQELLDRVLKTQEGIAESRLGSAEDWRQQYEQSIQPLEQQLIQDAQTYASPQRQEQAAGTAMSQVGQAFEAQRNNAQQRLESYGIDPSNTRSQALDANVRQQEAMAKVQAANEARRYTEDKGRELRGQAISLGQQNLNREQQATADAYNYGSGTLQNQLAGYQGGQQLVGGAIPFLGSAGQFYDKGTSLQDRKYGNERIRAGEEDAKYSNITGGLGQLAGMAAAPFTGGASLAIPGMMSAAGGGTSSGGSYPGGGGPGAIQPSSDGFWRAAEGGPVIVPGYAGGGYVGPTNYDQNQASGVPGNPSNQQSMGGHPNYAAGVPMEGEYIPKGSPSPDGWTNVGAQDGAIRGVGGPKDDMIDAKLSDGEYVIPEEIVRRKGTEFFDKLVEKTKEGTPQAMPAGSAMVTTPPGGPQMGGAQGAIPTMACGGYIRRG